MRKIYAVAAAIVILAAGYSGYWFYIAGKLETGIEDWVAIQRLNGVEIAFERDKIHGFPGNFRTNFRQPTVKLLVNARSVTWSGADIAARMSPFDLHDVAFSTPGEHLFQGPDGNLYIQAGKLDGWIELDAGGLLQRAALELEAARIKFPNSLEIQASSAHLAVDLPPQPPTKYPDQLIGFDLAAEHVALPPGTKLLTTEPLTRIAAAGEVLGPLPPAPMSEALTIWRDAGGVLNLKSFAFAQGPLSVTGNATIALDRNLQPEGAASLAARGLAPTVDLLAGQGLIASGDALKFKAFAMGAARQGADGVPEVATGLTLQDGLLSWGPFPVMRMPPVAW